MSWKAERRRLSYGRGSTVFDVGDLTPVLVARVWYEEVVAVEVRSPSRLGSRAVHATPQAASVPCAKYLYHSAKLGTV